MRHGFATCKGRLTRLGNPGAHSLARMKTTSAVLLLFFLTPAFAASGPVPKNEGQCVATTIASIGTRLEGIEDSDDQVTYTNGVLQVSYMAIKGLKGAKVGDTIKLCLIAIPDDCPPGDERGKTYRATDLRTHKSWEAPDSEHMCGGA